MDEKERRNIQRRIDLTFEFVNAAVNNPDLLDAIPDEAIIGMGDAEDPELTAETRALVDKACKASSLPGVVVTQRRLRRTAKDPVVEYDVA